MIGLPVVPSLKSARRRLAFAGAMAAFALLAPREVGPAAAAPGVLRSDKLVIVSTTDVKGKTSPCGCHVPRGGFARRETFIDSLRTGYGQVLAVDCGGWFPEGDSTYERVATFVAQEMSVAALDAAGTSERELHYGLAFLLSTVRAAHLPLVCANLWYKAGERLVLPAFQIVKSGGVTVGVFSLMSNTVPLGPAADSLRVEDPIPAARRAIEAMRARGATVIVLLANLGKVEGEDLVTAVEGVDAMVVGHNVPILAQGRMVRNTIASYGGEQGHYVAVTTLDIDPQGRSRGGSATTYVMGPDVRDMPSTLNRVRAFEDAFNTYLRKVEQQHALENAVPTGDPAAAPHFLGAEACGRCHAAEYAQWQRTPHAGAWHALTAAHKDATPECIACHAVGYQQAGGFRVGADSLRAGSVQCESCHGMGTEHEAWAAGKPRVSEAVCRRCHDATNSPTFKFDVYLPHVLHGAPATLPALPARGSGGAGAP